jgi:hypothetical protein
MTIVNFYIEVESDPRWIELESLLREHKYAFLDATANDPYTRRGSNYSTLESIEADLDCK